MVIQGVVANPPGINPDPQQSKMNTSPRKLNKG